MSRFCPKCKSSNISPVVDSRTISKGSLQDEYKCNNCGYEGMFFPLT